MPTLLNQRGDAIDVVIEIRTLHDAICGTTTSDPDDPSRFLITINPTLILRDTKRAKITVVHELLHCLNWKAGYDVHRHRACHYLAAALTWGVPLRYLKIRDPKCVEAVTMMLQFARQWIRDVMMKYHNG